MTRKTTTKNPARVSRETDALLPPGAPVEQIPLDQIEVLPGNPDPDPIVLQEILTHGIDEPVILLAPGCLIEPDYVELSMDPAKHLLLAGATRLAAAQALGQAFIDARVRHAPLQITDAVAFALRSNTGRRLVTSAELAGRVRQLANCGLNDRDISAKLAINDREVNQLRRFNTLPTAWQQRVTRYEHTQGDENDALPWSAAKALLPYTQLPEVLKELETDWSDARWNRNDMRSRDAFRNYVHRAVQDHTRPMSKDQLASLTPDQETLLDIRSLPTGKNGSQESLACCDPEIFRQIFPNPTYPTVTLRDNTAPKPPAKDLSTADIAAKAKADDAELKDRIQRPGGLAEIALRLACQKSPELKPGSPQARSITRWLSVCARDTGASAILEPATWITSAGKIYAARTGAKHCALPSSIGFARPMREDYGHFWAFTKNLDDELDGHDQIDVIFCQLVLWPQTDETESPDLYQPDKWPEHLPWIHAWLLDRIAERLIATVAQTWKASQRPEHLAAWTWFNAFLQTHNRRQLSDFAKASMPFGPSFSCPSVAEFAELKNTDQITALQEAHRRDNLRLPKILQPKKTKP